MPVTEVDYLFLIGKSLSVPEQSALACSLPLLTSRYNAPAHFWGKITGVKNDYLIAQVSPKGFFGPRVSFYSVDGGNLWVMLEELTEDQAAYCDLLRGLYQGDPEYTYKMRKDIPPDPEPVVTLPNPDEVLLDALKGEGGDEDGDAEDDEANEEESEEDENEEEEEEEPEVAPRKRGPKYMILSLKEHYRISHFVAHHDAACRLTVRGEYILTGKPIPEKNRAFAGQPVHNALKPSCYLKAMEWGQLERNKKLYGPTFNVHSDFLSPITDDMPVGVWGLKYDPSFNVVAVQNYFYEGSLFWYRPGTLQHGQVYFGCGEPNYELCFTI